MNQCFRTGRGSECVKSLHDGGEIEIGESRVDNAIGDGPKTVYVR